MSNLIQLSTEHEYFINSEKIKIFPCAYRGTKQISLNTDPSATRTIAFQPTARSFSEENLTNTYGRLGTTASYLISNSRSSTEHKIELLLGGYYLVVWLDDADINTIASNSLQFCLSTTEIDLYEIATGSGGALSSMQATTTVIRDLVNTSTAVGDQLDHKLDSSTSGSTYYFAGVKLTATPNDYTYSLKIIDSTGKFLYESRPIFENLKTGHGFNSLINAGNKPDEVVACAANGDYSTALGKSTVVEGNCGFAIGEFAVSTGNAAVACGNQAIANGDYSFSCGYATNTMEPGGVAFGKNTLTYSTNQLVIGQFNEIPASETKPDTAFTIGIGSDTNNRKNLLNILKNGDTVLDGANNAIVVGATNKKASLLVSDTLNLDHLGNLTLMKNKRVKFGDGLVIDNTNAATKAAKMTLNGSFHETGTFTLGTNESSPKVEISNSKTAINYNNVSIGTNASNVVLSTSNITVHNKNIIIDTANTVNINNATTFDTQNSKLNNTLYVTKCDSGTVVTIGTMTAENYPASSLATQGGLFTKGNLQANVSDTKKFIVDISSDENKLTFGKVLEVNAKTTKSTLNTELNILNSKVNITNTSASCFGVTVNSSSITAPTITSITAANAVISCNRLNAGESISTNTFKLQDTALSQQPLLMTPVKLEGPIANIDTPAIKIGDSYIDVKQKSITNCNNIVSTDQETGVTINGQNLISTKTFKLGQLQGSTDFVIEGNGYTSQKFFKVNGTTTINGDTGITGNLTVSGTVKANELDTNSDIRLKENIVDFTNKNSILDLPIKKFNYIADASKTVHIGCIAQDLQQIYPELVHTDDNGYLSIEESKLVYLLIDEVKKLKEEVKKLKEN